MIFDLIERHWEILYGLLVAVGLVVYVAASQGFHQRRHPSAAIAWVLGIVLLPYLTLPLYLVFGSRKVVVPAAAGKSARRILAPGVSAHTTTARAQQLGLAMGLPDPVPYGNLSVHEDGAQALAALRRIIEGARQTLDVSTFLLGRDVLGDEIGEQLKRRAREGVRVRLMIDGIGLYMGGYPDLEDLRAAGVDVLRFVPPFRSPKRGRTNLRNHRKMVIADRTRFWCGGRNLAAEYFEGDPRVLLGRKAWVDLSFDLDGEIACQAARQFDLDWAFASEKELPEVPSPEGVTPATASLAQLVASGPDSRDDALYTLLVSAGFTSQRRILAVTPYFVPPHSLLTSLTLAARRGVEVDLVLPVRSNHRLADFVRHRALRELAGAGARVWFYPGMVHAKAVVIDDELAFCGSANLDVRSLFLNYEMTVAFYDRRAVNAFSRWIEARRQESTRYRARHPGLLRDLGEGLLLWLAFQL